MLKRFIRAVIAAFRTVSFRWEAFPGPRIVTIPRPVWDDGTNYDIPTFLRRRHTAT